MKNNHDNFIIFLSCSIVLHLFAIYFFLFGLPVFFNKSEELEEVIYFEMLPTSDISNVQNKKKAQEQEIKNEEAKKVAQTKSEPVEEKKITEEKPVEKEIEEKKVIEEDSKEQTIDKPKEIIEIKKQKEPPAKKIKEAQKNIPTKEKKDAVKDNKKKKPNNSELDSLLKTLEQSSEGISAKSAKYARSHNDDAEESKGSYDENLPLSITEVQLIKTQIENCWNKPIGAKNIDQIRVILSISLAKDGTLLDVQVVQKICPGVSVDFCDSLTNSAIIAVKKASPIANLNPDRYNVWKLIQFEFDPSKISR